MYFVLLAVRSIHQVQQMVADGWGLFEEAMVESGLGDLPNILWALKTTLTRPPRTPALPGDVKMEDMPPPLTPSPKLEAAGSRATTPLAMTLCSLNLRRRKGGKVTYKYGCPISGCEHPVMASKHSMDAHIRENQTLEPHLCTFCNFTSFNFDSVMKHKRKQHPKPE